MDPCGVAAMERPVGTSPWLLASDGCAPHTRQYLIGLLSQRLGDAPGIRAAADSLAGLAADPGAANGAAADPSSARLAAEMRRGLLAASAHMNGDLGRALTLLEDEPAPVPHEVRWVSPFHSLPHTRFLRAEVLYQLGRYEEALGWYGSLAEHSPFDLALLGPALARQAEIHQTLGDRAGAAWARARLQKLRVATGPERPCQR
jgi:tetratricopeptide (TPR) repeat protein